MTQFHTNYYHLRRRARLRVEPTNNSGRVLRFFGVPKTGQAFFIPKITADCGKVFPYIGHRTSLRSSLPGDESRSRAAYSFRVSQSLARETHYPTELIFAIRRKRANQLIPERRLWTTSGADGPSDIARLRPIPPLTKPRAPSCSAKGFRAVAVIDLGRGHLPSFPAFATTRRRCLASTARRCLRRLKRPAQEMGTRIESGTGGFFLRSST